jgi:hypothetical protein
MTVSSAVSRMDYIGNGALATYPFTFEIYINTDLKVYVAGVLKTVDVHYTIPVAGINNPAGGNVVFVVGSIPVLNAAIAIILDLPLTQLINYVEGDKFPAETHEKALDRQVKIAQAFKEVSKTVLKVAASTNIGDIIVPIAAGELLQWNDDADAIVTVPTWASGDPLPDHNDHHENGGADEISLTGLSGEPSECVLLAGRAGGQIIYGGTGSGDNLTLYSTSHGTKGYLEIPFDALKIDTNAGVATLNMGLDDVWTCLDVRANPPDSMNDKFFVGHFQVFVGTEDCDTLGAFNHKVGLFAGAQRNSSRTEEIWAFNTLINVDTGADSYSAIGYELDVNNRHADMPDADAVTASLDGLHINSGGTKRPYCGLLINQVGVGNAWRRGIWIPYTAVSKVGIEVGDFPAWTAASILCQQWGNGNSGIMISRATDTVPTGSCLAITNAANSANLFYVSAAEPTANLTNVWLTMNNGSVVLRQVETGANDSGGVGWRMLRILN